MSVETLRRQGSYYQRQEELADEIFARESKFSAKDLPSFEQIHLRTPEWHGNLLLVGGTFKRDSYFSIRVWLDEKGNVAKSEIYKSIELPTGTSGHSIESNLSTEQLKVLLRKSAAFVEAAPEIANSARAKTRLAVAVARAK